MPFGMDWRPAISVRDGERPGRGFFAALPSTPLRAGSMTTRELNAETSRPFAKNALGKQGRRRLYDTNSRSLAPLGMTPQRRESGVPKDSGCCAPLAEQVSGNS